MLDLPFPSISFLGLRRRCHALEELVNSGVPHISRVGEFSFPCDIKNFALGGKNRNGGDAFCQGHSIRLGNVKVLVEMTNIDFDNLEVPLQQRCAGPFLHGEVQYSAVRAPIGAKNNDDRGVGGGGPRQRLFDFESGVRSLAVRIVRRSGIVRGGATAQNQDDDSQYDGTEIFHGVFCDAQSGNQRAKAKPRCPELNQGSR